MYNLIRICEGEKLKTAFMTPMGHNEYLVMPYGLGNTPSVFQDFLHEVLGKYLHQFVLVCIKDIYSRSLAEHRQHLSEVFQCWRNFQLFLKSEQSVKMLFGWITGICYLALTYAHNS